MGRGGCLKAVLRRLGHSVMLDNELALPAWPRVPAGVGSVSGGP